MFLRPKEDRDGGWGVCCFGLQEPQSILCWFFRGKRTYLYIPRFLPRLQANECCSTAVVALALLATINVGI